MRGNFFVLLLACRPPVSVPGPWTPAPGATLREAEAACAAHYCSDLRTNAWDACRVETCPTVTEAWSVSPERVRAGADGVVAIDARVAFTPGTVAGHPVTRSAEAYLGVTMISQNGREYDLAIQTLFPGAFNESVTFLAETGATPEDPIRDVILGLWDRKITPCDSERPGCKAFGFLLDGSLAAWPPRTYTDGQRQRVAPEEVTLQVIQGGGPLSAASLEERTQAAAAALTQALAPFGSRVRVLPPSVTEGEFGAPKLSARDPHDAHVVSVAAHALGAETARQQSDADFTLAVDAPR